MEHRVRGRDALIAELRTVQGGVVLCGGGRAARVGSERRQNLIDLGGEVRVAGSASGSFVVQRFRQRGSRRERQWPVAFVAPKAFRLGGGDTCTSEVVRSTACERT